MKLAAKKSVTQDQWGLFAKWNDPMTVQIVRQSAIVTP